MRTDLTLDQAAKKETRAEKHRIYLKAVAKDWGTGVAKSGPEAGRRFYIGERSWGSGVFFKQLATRVLSTWNL
jgi:hypothetical protein